jgi:Whi5 like
VARNLQDCLALASFKAQNGWQDRTLRAIEPEVTEQLKKKRPYSDDILSDTSSSNSETFHYALSPSGLPAFTNQRQNPAIDAQSQFKMPVLQQFQRVEPRKRIRSNSTTSNIANPSRNITWKQDHRLPQSSPANPHPQASASFSRQSFVSDPATMPHSTTECSPMFDMHGASDNDDDVPVHSFHRPTSSSMISSSPPRTPPPNRCLRNGTSKQAGADLLLYLANSPSRSPATSNARLRQVSQQPPSTPPSQNTHLPSSVMNTPGANISLFNGALNTPGQGFNFADFVNITPSPAQLPWGGRTPGMPRTPAMARTARRGLNFDALVPPTSHSPLIQRKTPTSQGLALELGEELIPRS